jgi:hypothetical protein
MKWFPLLGRLRIENRLPDMAEEIAAHSRSAVWSRVVDAASEMGRNEARGYVRARAAEIVNGAIDAYLLENGTLAGPVRLQLVELTTDQVVSRTVADLFHSRPQTSVIRRETIPMPVATPLRRAA